MHAIIERSFEKAIYSDKIGTGGTHYILWGDIYSCYILMSFIEYVVFTHARHFNYDIVFCVIL